MPLILFVAIGKHSSPSRKIGRSRTADNGAAEGAETREGGKERERNGKSVFAITSHLRLLLRLLSVENTCIASLSLLSSFPLPFSPLLSPFSVPSLYLCSASPFPLSCYSLKVSTGRHGGIDGEIKMLEYDI